MLSPTPAFLTVFVWLCLSSNVLDVLLESPSLYLFLSKLSFLQTFFDPFVFVVCSSFVDSGDGNCLPRIEFSFSDHCYELVTNVVYHPSRQLFFVAGFVDPQSADTTLGSKGMLRTPMFLACLAVCLLAEPSVCLSESLLFCPSVDQFDAIPLLSL